MDEEKVLTPTEQLTEYCDCIDVNERDVNELINLVSTYTCWAQSPCETFLKSERREVIDIPDCACDCDTFPFAPYYAPFDKDSFVFTLVERTGTDETLTVITDVHYSEVDETFYLNLPLPSCQCAPQCGCKTEYKLLVEYVAGYETIPECLLPLLCEALQWIIEKNKCDCEECEQCSNKDYRNQPEIAYTSLTGRLQEHFLNVLTRQYFSQLALISLCRRYKGELWGIVV